MKILKKVLSALLAVTMLLSITAGLNLTAFADESDFSWSELDDGTVEISYYGSASNVTIPTTIAGYKVTAISTYGFGEKTNLKSVTIPNGITSIGANAFKDCTNLNSITIPNSITSIGYGAFENTAYYNNRSNWINGVLYIGNCLIEADKEIVSGSYAIKSGTTVIAEEGFNACYNITSVTIPNSVKYIGSGSFSNLNITSITIPDSVINIGTGPFSGCLSLTSITVASGNKNYKSVNGVLYNKNQTELIQYPVGNTASSFSIPSSVTKIADYAFEDSFDLTNITIPNSVTSIGRLAFWGTGYCDNENNWTNGVLYIGNCLIEADKEIVSGSYSIKSGTTVIADGAFDSCESLTNIIIPTGIKQIGDSVFYYCENLKSVTIPNSVTSIGDGAFEDCCNLTSVTIPNSVTSIGNRAFADCEKLSSVTIGNNVKSIGQYAFAWCDSLKSITVPKSVTQIGWHAFPNNDNDDDFVLNCYYDSAAHRYAEKEYITYKFVSNDGIEKINNFETKTVTLSSENERQYLVFTPTENGKYYIYVSGEAWCDVYNSNMLELEEAYDDYSAWYDLEKGKTYYLVLRSGDTPATCNITIGLVHNHKFSNGKCTICGTSEFQYIVLSGGTAEITRYLGSATNLTIPSTIDGYKVTSIGSMAFSNCQSLTSVTIPSGVTSINNDAFWGCKNLKSVTIPNSVKSIGDSAFGACGLTSVTIPSSVTSLGVDVFYNCDKLTNITVDSNNKNYTSLNGVLYNKGKTAILAYPKAKADSSYTAPNTVTSIVYGPFRDCNNLKSVSLPTSVKSIEEESFGSCKNLSSITIRNKNCEIKANEYYSTIPKATTINGYKGSTAETYAKKFGNNFVELAETETKLAAPKAKAVVNANGGFTISWNKISGADKYDVYYDNGTGYKLLRTVTGTSTTTGTAPYGKKYSYKVRAVNSKNSAVTSAFSTAVTATNTKKLQTPTLKATVNANGSFKLSWNKVEGATRYGIYMLESNGKYKWIKSTSATSWTTGTAQYGKKYTYKVFAVNDNTSAKSEFSSAVSATNNKKLQATTAKVTVNANGSFKLSWNKVTGATKYGIYMKQANGSYKWIKTVTGTSWTTAVAAYGKQYTYKVLAANNNKSAQTFSNVVNAKNTKKLQTPSLKVAVNKNGSFKLSWGKVTGATSYQIYMKQSNGTYKLIKTTSSTSFTTAVASKGKTYSYKVRAVTSKNKNATSAYSKVVSAKRK